LKCKLCGSGLKIDRLSGFEYCSDTYFNYYPHYYIEKLPNRVFEMFKYENGKFGVQAVYHNEIIVCYNLYYTIDKSFTLRADQLTFNPLNPANVINKIKMILTFS
jgi:hypothetical protein